MTQAFAPRPLPSLVIVPYSKVRRSDVEARAIADSLTHELSAALVAQGVQATVHRTDVILFPEPPNAYIRPEPAREVARAADSDMVVVVYAERLNARQPLFLEIWTLNPDTGLPAFREHLDWDGHETEMREDVRDSIAPRLIQSLRSRT
jgi:F420-dependent methylenetetrahydromethanopterin dehydrogenase